MTWTDLLLWVVVVFLIAIQEVAFRHRQLLSKRIDLLNEKLNLRTRPDREA